MNVFKISAFLLYLSPHGAHVMDAQTAAWVSIAPKDTLSCTLELPGIEPPTFGPARPPDALDIRKTSKTGR